MAYPDSAVETYYEFELDNTNVDSSLTDFPVVLDLANLPTAVRTWLYDNLNATGDGIRITTTSDVALNYERQNFAKVAGSPNVVTGQLYYKVPTVNSGVVTSLRLFANNGAADGEAATSVWDSNFKSVYHLDAAGNATQPDSTSTSNNLTPQNMESGDSVTGKVGKGIDLDGSNEYLTAGSNPSLTPPFTVSIWMKPGTALNGECIWSYADSATSTDRHMIIIDATNGNKIAVLTTNFSNGVFANVGAFSASAAVASTWYHVTGIWSATNDRKLYINGSYVSQNTTTISPSSLDRMWLGRFSDLTPNWEFDGVLDECRISTVARSASWIKFTYHNTNEADNEHQNFTLVTPSAIGSVIAPSRRTRRNVLLRR